MIRTLSAVFAVTVAMAAAPAAAAEPDGLVLPPGFHASVVADGLTGARHMAIASNGDIYVSTRHGKDQPSMGIYALRLGPDHKAVQTEHFGSVDGGTGIRIYRGGLYASSSTGVHRFALDGNLVPAAAPTTVVDGLTATNHPIAFDGKGGLFVSIDGGGGVNNCHDPKVAKDAKPVGLNPCPLLEVRGGVWRFSDSATDQKLADGEHYATGLRNMSAMDVRGGDSLYGAWHGRDGTSRTWPDLVTPAQDDAIADEMFRITRNTNMGWPYTYWDGVRNVRLTGPEYGGDGKTPVTDRKYATPVAAFAPQRPAVLDLTFYTGKKFPRSYQGGAFLAMHGGGADGTILPNGHAGYRVMFVPFTGNGRAGTPVVFADGFAGPTAAERNTKTAAYRPVGVAVGPDGALYVVESNKGRIWRIAYGE